MRSLYLAAVLSLAALPVWAEQPDPAQAFISEWGDMGVAARTLDWASGQIATKAQALVADWQRQRDELAAVKKDAASAAAFWKAWCGGKPGCVTPSE